MTRFTVTAITAILLFFLPKATLAQEAADSTRHTLVEKLFEKGSSESLQVRLDIRPSFHTSLRPTDDDTEGTFRFDYLMLNLSGRINDRLSYQYTQRLHEGTKAFAVENLSSSINYAYLTYDFHPRWSLTAGKQAILYAGFEYTESPIDVVTYSTPNAYLNCYLTGLTLTYRPSATQEVAVQAVNNRLDGMTDYYGTLPEGFKRSRLPLFYSVAWNSSYCDDHLQLRYAASAGEQARGHWAFMVGGGQEVAFDKVDFHVDVLYQRSSLDHMGALRELYINPEGVQGASAVRHAEYLTVVGKLNYRFLPRWNFHAKGFYDRASVYEATPGQPKGKYLSTWCYEGGVEYYPGRKQTDLYCYLTVANQLYGNAHKAEVATPDNATKLYLGFVYRIPVF